MRRRRGVRARCFAAVLALSGTGAGAAEAGLDLWTTSGPGASHGGLGHMVAIDPVTPSTLYAGSNAQGLFKSVDGGVSWTAMSTGLTSLLMRAVLVDPQTPTTVYAATSPFLGPGGGVVKAGIFKSTDGAQTWTRMHTGIPDSGFESGVASLAVNPATPTTLYAGTSQPVGVFKTADGAATWTSATGTGLEAGTTVSALVAPGGSSAVFAGTTTAGVFVTTDGGATWQPRSNGLTSLFIFDLAIEPSGVLWAATQSGVFRSGDGGNVWTPVNSGLPEPFVRAVIADPSAPGTVYAGTNSNGVFRTTDGGASWTAMNQGLGNLGIQSFAISPSGACLHATTLSGPVWSFATREDTCAPVPPPPPPPTDLVASVLPSSRSVRVAGPTPASAFVTVGNAGAETAVQVGIALPAALPASLTHQQTDCATNAPSGPVGAKVSIPPANPGAGESGFRCFVIVITPSATFPPTEVAFTIAGVNTPPVPTLVGINTLLLSASAGPVPDIVALVATGPPNNGIVDVPVQGGAAFAMATVNVGEAGDQITATADTGAAALPLAISLCRTDPVGGQCLTPVGPSVTIPINPNETHTFGIFVSGLGTPVAFDPATNRIFVRLRDSGGVIRGSTSVAARTI